MFFGAVFRAQYRAELAAQLVGRKRPHAVLFAYFSQ
jgi:hypothetical protein